MSDAMTNREIEDVLTSIRRLVAQEGGRNAETGRLILTEAQRIVSEATPGESAQGGTVANQGQSGAMSPADDSDHGLGTPLELTDPVLSVESDTDASGDAESEHGLPAPDFGQLEATIAELEAAVSGGSVAEEPDDESGTGTAVSTDAEPAPEPHQTESVATEDAPSNVTALYGRLSFQHRRQASAENSPAAPRALEPSAEATVQRAEPSVAAAPDAPVNAPEVDAAEADVMTDRYALPEDPPRRAMPSEGDGADTAHARFEAAPEPQPEPEAEDPAAVADRVSGDAADQEPEDTVIDEDMLRIVVAHLVREELHGQLGERITLQVRKLVRAEIAKALDERNYL